MANPNEDPISNLTQQVAQILELVQTMTQRIKTLDKVKPKGLKLLSQMLIKIKMVGIPIEMTEF